MDEFYRVPLTSSEALATLALLRALERLAPDTDVEPGIWKSAAERVADEVPEFVAAQAEALARSLADSLRAGQAAEPNGEDGDERTDPPFPTRRTRRLLEDAFERGVLVEIEYYVASRKQWTTRRVEISDVFARDGTAYLSGHCEMRGDFRQFRLDHVRAVRVLDDLAAGDPFTEE
jgi:predicted DNA-binding transcriptional regulator YafY